MQPKLAETRTVSSLDLSSTRIRSSATLRSISATVLRTVFSALYAGITTQTRFPAIIPSPVRQGPPTPPRGGPSRATSNCRTTACSRLARRPRPRRRWRRPAAGPGCDGGRRRGRRRRAPAPRVRTVVPRARSSAPRKAPATASRSGRAARAGTGRRCARSRRDRRLRRGRARRSGPPRRPRGHGGGHRKGQGNHEEDRILLLAASSPMAAPERAQCAPRTIA